MVGDLAILDPEEVALRPGSLLPGCRHTHIVTLHRAGIGNLGGHEIAFGNLQVDRILEIRERRTEGAGDHLEALAPGRHPWRKLTVFTAVRCHHLVDHFESPLAEDFHRDAAADRFDVF